jgi:hypothetical protein
VSVLRVRGRALPDGEPVDLYADGDRWTTEPVAGAELVAEGWLLPGLVDAHTHPGADKPGEPLDETLLRNDLHEHVAAGVTMIRSPGLAGDPPAWFGRDSDVPRAVHAGPWIAQVGQFFDGWGRRASHAELPALAAAQAQRTGWAKLIGDWSADGEPIPVEVLAAVVEAVHAVGGRVAVHAQQPAGSAAAVAAKVDTLEHGMCLDPALLAQMAAQGTVLTPTLHAITGSIKIVEARPDSPRRDWYLGGATVHGDLCAAAGRHGLTAARAGRQRDPRAGGGRRPGARRARGGLLGSPGVPGAARAGRRRARRRGGLRQRPAGGPGPGRPPAGRHPARPAHPAGQLVWPAGLTARR